MLPTQSRLEEAIELLRTRLNEERAQKRTLETVLRRIAGLLSDPVNGETEDVAAFGRDAWVYCNQHRQAHETGWCSVSPRDKVGLGVTTEREAQEKCRAWGFQCKLTEERCDE